MPQLKIKSGPSKGKVFEIQSDSVKLGRDSNCEVKLKDNGVSREHAEIYKVGEMYFIRDLGSRNGIIVNDLPIEDELLRDGDIIRICSYSLVFSGTTAILDQQDDLTDSDSFYESEHDPASTLTIKVSPDKWKKGNKDAAKLEMALGKLQPVFKKEQRPEILIEETINAIFDVIEVQECYVFMIEPGNKLVQKAYKSAKGTKKGKASKSIVLRALKEGNTIFTANAQDDFRFKSESSIVIKNINSVLCCPLIAGGKEAGVVYLNNGALNPPFNEDNADLVSLIASFLAAALSNLASRRRERNIQNQSVHLLANITERHVPTLEGRGERVSQLAKSIGEVMNLKAIQLENLVSASYLHHIGYMEYPQGKEFSLSELQTNTDYVEKTLHLMTDHGGFSHCFDMVKFHRHRKDGTGYPEKFSGKSWSIESQILACATIVELYVNQPISFQEDSKPLSDILEDLKPVLSKAVDSEIVIAFDEALSSGKILNE